jgi:hypothetical protein
MDEVQIHLLFNHFPVIGNLIFLFILLYGLISRNDTIQRLSLVGLVVVGVLTIPAFLSGEGAEHTVEKLGVSHDIIHEHEEHAETAFLVGMISAGLALITLVLEKLGLRIRALIWLTLIASTLTLGLMVITAKDGGLIRHTELNQVEHS